MVSKIVIEKHHKPFVLGIILRVYPEPVPEFVILIGEGVFVHIRYSGGFGNIKVAGDQAPDDLKTAPAERA